MLVLHKRRLLIFILIWVLRIFNVHLNPVEICLVVGGVEANLRVFELPIDILLLLLYFEGRVDLALAALLVLVHGALSLLWFLEGKDIIVV